MAAYLPAGREQWLQSSWSDLPASAWLREWTRRETIKVNSQIPVRINFTCVYPAPSYFHINLQLLF